MLSVNDQRVGGLMRMGAPGDRAALCLGVTRKCKDTQVPAKDGRI